MLSSTEVMKGNKAVHLLHMWNIHHGVIVKQINSYLPWDQVLKTHAIPVAHRRKQIITWSTWNPTRKSKSFDILPCWEHSTKVWWMCKFRACGAGATHRYTRFVPQPFCIQKTVPWGCNTEIRVVAKRQNLFGTCAITKYSFEMSISSERLVLSADCNQATLKALYSLLLWWLQVRSQGIRMLSSLVNYVKLLSSGNIQRVGSWYPWFIVSSFLFI